MLFTLQADKVLFEKAYSAAYRPALEICAEMYDEVASGNEIKSVVMHGERLGEFPIGKIDGTFTWKGSLISLILIALSLLWAVALL